jgi:hypothetical protein
MDFVQLIRETRIVEAYIIARNSIDNKQTNLNADKCWVKIYEDGVFDENLIVIDRAVLPEDLHQAIRIYFCLSIIDWDESKRCEFRKAAKTIIAMVSREYRIWLNEDRRNFLIDPNLRVFLQDLISHFSADKLFKDKADISAVKAQFSGTLLQCNLIKKHEFGNDMLQYADDYAYLNLKDQALQIYQAIMNDFTGDLNSSFKAAFPEVGFINDFSSEENEIFNKARNRYERLKLAQ